MSSALNAVERPIKAVRLALFPTMDSPEQVLEYAASLMPITDKNTLFSVIFMYHNTILKLSEQNRTT